ncbi:MAG: Nif3-like dinuclear metal center hexameric protein [Chlamydiales bacterium]|nr:Nif3-like dinuclear metal center hexameric protein [Chlamydiales bacterium]
MLLNEFSENLDLYLSASLFKDYCPNGIQVEGKEEVRRVATAVSANLQTLERAADIGIDALVVHHGIFWNRDPYPIAGAKKKKIQLLLERGISLLAYHLPLDAHREVGNNWKAALDLGWQNLEPFGELNGTEIGVKGTFEAQSVDAFVKKIETYYGHNAAAALKGKKRVESAALISGGAYRELATAAKAGVDCFITGNFDEPAWGVAYEEEIHFLALGHSATEKIGPKALAEYMGSTWGLESQFIDNDNPF